MILKFKAAIVLMIFLSRFAFCQDFQSVTTQEEYNYMKNGYKTQIEQGLDMKKGYSIDDSYSRSYVVGNYTFDYKFIVKNNDYFVGYIVKAVSKSWGNTYWYCIPNKNTELFSDFYKQMSSLDLPMTLAFFKSYVNIINLFKFHLNLNPSTTIEEYNFMIKGYKTLLEQGLDMKKGYHINDENSLSFNLNETYSFDIMSFYRTKEDEFAGFIVKITNKVVYSNKTSYICIPNYSADENILNMFYTELSKIDENKLTAIFAAYVYYNCSI